jgi:hypothetical protein
MIPNASIDVTLTTSDTSESSKTYKISEQKIQGYTDGAEALQQAINKLLNTEKYEYPIYSFSYGIELESLIGKDKLYVQMELIRRIKECLLQDERIKNVVNFNFTIKGDSILCTFDVISIYGITSMAKEVSA